MKKYLSLFITVTLLFGCLTACGRGGGTAQGSEALQIVVTIFPEYDWVKNILGDTPTETEVTMLLDSGVDLHSYQPTAADMLKISACDLFIYVGGESDQWVNDALKEPVNPDRITLNLLDALGDAVKEEERVEGMQAEEEDAEGENAEEETEYDEHVWLSLRNAGVLVGRIAEAVEKLDPANAAVYQSNASAYVKKLNALDAQYEAAVTGAAVKTLLFGDRFPFRYLADDYGLMYYAAFVGCSAETEASFETVTFLAGKVDELSLHAVMTIEGSDRRIAETIVQNTRAKNQQILTLDSMQSVTMKDVLNGASYLTVMENNLAVLKDALK